MVILKDVIMYSSTFLFIFLLSWRSWLAISSTPHHQNEEIGLFTNTSIVDYQNGSMDDLGAWLKLHPIALVVFYTSWSGQAIKVVPELLLAKKRFGNSSMPSIAGINCWVGQCRHNFQSLHFPRLFLYHTHFQPIEFFDDIKADNIVRFLQLAIRPYHYIQNKKDLDDFQNEHDSNVLVYINPKIMKRSRKFNVIFEASLNLLSHVNRPIVGFVLRRELASLVGLQKHGNFTLISNFFHTKYYPDTLNFTSSAIVSWIINNSKKLITELTPNPANNLRYISQLKHPSLILALPSQRSRGDVRNTHLINQMHQVARNYYNCSCLRQKKRKTHFYQCNTYIIHGGVIYSLWENCMNNKSICLWNDRTLYTLQDMYLARTAVEEKQGSKECLTLSGHHTMYLDRVSQCCYKQVLGISDGINFDESVLKYSSINSNGEVKLSTFELNLMVNEYLGIKLLNGSINSATRAKTDEKCGGNAPCCSDKPNIRPTKHLSGEMMNGLACRTNRTLNFYVLDSKQYGYLLHNAGIRRNQEGIALFIADLPAEEHFVLKGDIEYSTLVPFILNFTFGNLLREYDSLKNHTKHDELHRDIIELSTSSFDHEVLQNNQNVLVMFYANWCGVCKPANLEYRKLMENHEKHAIKYARIDNDKYELPWRYTASVYPSFILFPANGKENSIPFPLDQEITLVNFVTFLSSALD